MIRIKDEEQTIGITLHIMSDYKSPEQRARENKEKKKLLEKERKQRLGSALRENLLKRKAQMRARLELDQEEIKTSLEESRKIA